MLDYKSKALDILSEMPEGESKSALSSLVEYVVERKK